MTAKSGGKAAFKLFAGILAAVVLAVSVTGCGSGQQAAGGIPAGPVKIGVINSFSGPLQNYAEQEWRGLQLGLKYATNGSMAVDGHPIDLIKGNDNGSPSTGVQEAKKLILDDQVALLTGPSDSSVAAALIPLAKQYQKVLVVDPAADDAITGKEFNQYVFRTAVNSSQYTAAFAAAGGAMLDLVKAGFYQFAPDYSYGQSAVAAWKAALVKVGGNDLGQTMAPLKTTDFTPYLQHILSLNPLPKVLVVTWAGVGALTLLKQMQDLGMYNKMTVIGVIDSSQSVLKALGKSANGYQGVTDYYYALPDNPVNGWFVKNYEAQYNAPPDLFSATGFQAGQLIVQGIEKAGSLDSAKLISAMSGATFQSPKGTVKIRAADHQALQDMFVVKLVWDPKVGYCVPTLIKDVGPDDSAPPVTAPAS